jgi:transcription antitermination factor NusG
MASLPASQQVISQEFTYTANAQDLLLAGNDLPKWYAVFTLARHEKRVSAQCEQRQIESFLPLYKVKHRWKNRCIVDLELPLFPSYFFVRFGVRERVQVLQVPGVVRIVSSGRQMQPLPDDYINSLRDGLLVHRIEPHPGFAVGDWVRIKNGPMAGTEGVLERRKNELRVIVKLEMLARSVSVEVGAEEIESCDLGRAYS